MDNKELPQEVVNEIEYKYLSGEYINGGENVLYAKEGAQIAQSHYLKELQAKDTTIKEQAEKIEKLTGLLKEHVLHRLQPKTPNG